MTGRCARSLFSLLVLTFSEVLRADDTRPATQPGSLDLTQLTLTELASLQVTSVQRKPELLKDTVAAVSVITADEIGASGATSVPALLRRVPGIHVAQLDASQWAIGIRGFTNSVARSQLALMDGRSLYTPLFAGTFWDVQNAFPETVDRIEAVRGPGGTLWGANAVNGIVNIISKTAKDTQGGLVVLGGGNQERAFGRVRYGDRWGDKGAYRLQGMYFNRAAGHLPGSEGYDAWHMYQGGFRTDWELDASAILTVEGNLYSGRAGRRAVFATFQAPYVQTLEQDADLSGGYLRTRWNRPVSDGREITVQAYYDRTNRREPNFAEDRDTFDVDASYRFALPGRHEVVAGLGYRVSEGRTTSAPTLTFVPPDQADNLFSAFVEDTFQVVPGRLRLIGGTKLERNDYSGFELQPSVRLSFSASERHGVWLALTRAVRTPTRFDRDLVLNIAVAPGTPAFARLLGDPRFETERSLVCEGGYRGQLSDRLSVDLSAFYNRYPNLVSYEGGAPFLETGRLVIPLRTANGTKGTVSGAEVSSDVRPSRHLLLRAAYSYLNMQVSPQLSSNDTGSSAVEDASPRHQVMMSSTANLPGRVTLGGLYRWVARLPSQRVPSYSELDLKLAWRASERLELALAGQNLLHAHHVEFGSGAIGGSGTAELQIRRSVYAQASLRW
jgi:iron complex outermembrane recepter protein